MDAQMVVSTLPTQAEVSYKIEVRFRFNITPFVARQTANVYLLNNVGHMLSADDPTLVLGERPYWQVPVFCAFPEFGRREKIADLAVGAEDGAVLMEYSSPSSAKEMDRRAQVIYHLGVFPPDDGRD